MSKRLLLVIEDDEGDRLALGRAVARRPLALELAFAESLEEARAILAEHDVAVAVADLALSDGSGLELLESHPGTPFIVVTGAGSEAVAADALRKGAADYLVKDVGGRYLDGLARAVETTLLRQAGRRERERRLRELEQLAYALSHDLSRAIERGTIAGAALAERAGGAAHQEGRELQGGVTRLDSLLRGLADFTEASATLEERFGPVDLLDLVHEILDELRGEAGDAAVEVGWLPVVHGDRARLFQMLRNLIENALKFHAPGETARVSLAAAGGADEWILSVADSGIGIREAPGKRVFDLFQRGEGVESHPGSGVGLAVCKRIAERHGGRVWFEPAQGGGTVFFVSLPKAVDTSSRW